MHPRSIILTGEPQEGKSTLLAQCLERLHDLHQAGFLAKGLWQNNQRHGFDLINLATGITTPLARRNPSAAPGSIPFTFFRTGMEAGYHALDPKKCTGADLICIDEVGKLEMKNAGWAPFLSPLLTLKHPVHLWVVRKNLVEQVCHKWNLQVPVIISVNQAHPLTSLITHIRS